MFRLAGDGIPADREGLERALREGLHAEAEVAGWPAVERLAIDAGAGASGIGGPDGEGEGEPGPDVAAFTFRGRGISAGGVPLDVEVDARDAVFRYRRAPDGGLRLVPVSAGEGRLDAFAAREDLEAAISDALGGVLERNGFRLKEARLELEPAAADAVAFRLRISVRKLFSATVELSGEARIDPRPVASVSRLSVEGRGMSGRMLAGAFADRVRRYDGAEFDLAHFLPEGLAPREVRLEAEGGLRLLAKLGDGTRG